MSMASAVTDLQARAAEAGQAVGELVVVVHEDRPASSQVAIVDHLAEVVSELQAAAVDVAQLVAAVSEPRQLPAQLPHIDRARTACALVYWRDLRSYVPIHELRLSASRRDREWRSWERSVEVSMQRCEAPIMQLGDAVRAAWQEVGELLTHYLPPPGDLAVIAGSTPFMKQEQMSTRRSS